MRASLVLALLPRARQRALQQTYRRPNVFINISKCTASLKEMPELF